MASRTMHPDAASTVPDDGGGIMSATLRATTVGVLALVAGLAPSMGVLVAARVVQGLGAGMTSTALYVLVTRVYPQRLHTAILAGFSAAWVVPSIAGPFVAGLITQTIGWRW